LGKSQAPQGGTLGDLMKPGRRRPLSDFLIGPESREGVTCKPDDTTISPKTLHHCRTVEGQEEGRCQRWIVRMALIEKLSFRPEQQAHPDGAPTRLPSLAQGLSHGQGGLGPAGPSSSILMRPDSKPGSSRLDRMFDGHQNSSVSQDRPMIRVCRGGARGEPVAQTPNC
jgi:hypothetical protein